MQVPLPIVNIFFNPEERRFRALWRVLLQLLVMVVVVAIPVFCLTELATWLLKSGRITMNADLFDKVMDVAVGIIVTILVLISLRVSGRWLDRRRFEDFGFRIDAKWWTEFFLGLSLGVLLIAAVYLTEFLTGWVHISGTFHTSAKALPYWFAFLYPFIKACCVGVYEEAISRGYHLTNLREGFLGFVRGGDAVASIAAIVLSSAFFGLLHIRNPNGTSISTISIMINGAMLGTAFHLTGRLGLSIGLHMSWNLAQGWLFGFPVSGDAEISTIIQTVQSGPEWLTGGSFGPEGGMLGLGASVVGLLLLIAFRKKLKR